MLRGPKKETKVCGSLGIVGIVFHLRGGFREVSEEILKSSHRSMSKMYLQNRSTAPFSGSAVVNPTSLASMMMRIRSLASISGLRILCCHGCGVGRQLQLQFDP